MTNKLATWRMQWKNFRGYEQGPQIELPALTLLIGRNNVGKTSVYSPLLLLRQTLEANSPETALLFRGSAVDFGSYEDVVTDHDVEKEITFQLDFGNSSVRRRSSQENRPTGMIMTFGKSDHHPAEV